MLSEIMVNTTAATSSHLWEDTIMTRLPSAIVNAHIIASYAALL